MRCFTIQPRIFVERLISMFSIGYKKVSFDNIDDPLYERDNFTFYQQMYKNVYDENYFIYTFYRSGYDNIKDGRHYIGSEITRIDKLMQYYYPNFSISYSFNSLCLIELNIPNDKIGVFGELAEEKIITRAEALDRTDIVEFVLPCINKEWIVECYTWAKLPKVNLGINSVSIDICNGALIKPMKFRERAEIDDNGITEIRILNKEVPVIMNRTMILRRAGLKRGSEIQDRLSDELDDYERRFYVVADRVIHNSMDY